MLNSYQTSAQTTRSSSLHSRLLLEIKEACDGLVIGYPIPQYNEDALYSSCVGILIMEAQFPALRSEKSISINNKWVLCRIVTGEIPCEHQLFRLELLCFLSSINDIHSDTCLSRELYKGLCS